MHARSRLGALSLILGALLPPSALAQGAGVEIIEQGPCPTVPPTPDYVLEWAWAAGGQAEALEAARAEARRKLERTLCRGVSQARCDAATRHIASHGEGHWVEPQRRREQGAACAGVAVERRFLDQLDRDLARFDQDLSALAAQVREAVGDRPLSLEPPRWASGCGAGPLGANLQAWLSARLAGVKQAEGGAHDALSLTLAPGATRLTIDALHRPTGEALATRLGGFDLPLDLFQVAPDEVGTCHADGRLAPRAGAENLTVRVRTGVRDGLACEGSQAPLSISTSAPAHAWLFSVLPDGQAFLIWPDHPGGEALRGELSLGTLDVTRTPGGGDELLVAVAISDGDSWASAASWRGPCRLKEPLESWGFPSGAALDTATYTVLAPGEGACPEGGAAFDPAAMQEAILGLPICGG
jgi:hypothetical protein